MKIYIPLAVKVMVPLIGLMILVVSLSGYSVYQLSANRWQAELDTRLERVASLLAQTINPADLQQIRQPTDLDSPLYTQLATRLEQAITAGSLAWAGIYYRDSDYLYYWVDSDYTGVGYPFFYATPQHLATFTEGKPQRVEYTDEFGSYYGFVAPIVTSDENGEQVVGIVETVVDQESRYLLQREALMAVWPVLLVSSLVAVVMSLLITYLVFGRYLYRLEQGALALAAGQFGYTINLHTRDELERLANTFNQMSAQLDQLYRERAEQERVKREIEIARQVQQALFPAQIPQVLGLEVAAYCQPHRETSGDFYDLLPLGDGQLGVVVGDVSGKSIPAAMVMVAAQSAIRSGVHAHTSPARVLDQSNYVLHRQIPAGMFVAASYARLDARSREMVWANAGQVFPVLLHRARPANLKEYPRYLESTGAAFPLGIVSAITYEDQPIHLLPGDTLLFYTDGVIEAMNSANQLYGFERLEALVRSLEVNLSPQALIKAVLADIAAFVGQAEQHDDITLVAIKFADD
jgi:sigma-B regulation protein RsbU (phosphoserine phosphatase)